MKIKKNESFKDTQGNEILVTSYKNGDFVKYTSNGGEEQKVSYSEFKAMFESTENDITETNFELPKQGDVFVFAHNPNKQSNKITIEAVGDTEIVFVDYLEIQTKATHEYFAQLIETGHLRKA